MYFFFSNLKKTHTLLYTTVPSRDQSTGAKQVTDDDVIDGPICEPQEEKEKPLCKYGSLCYQTNKAHLMQFRHDKKKNEAKAAAKKKVMSERKRERERIYFLKNNNN